MTKRFLVILATLGSLILLSSNASAFKGFGNVKSVCSACPQPKADIVELKSGGEIRGLVLGENADFYVVYRYSELRAIPRNEIRNVKWASGQKPSELANTDTVLLKNGVAFAGRITENKDKPAMLQIKSDFNGFTYNIAKSQIDVAFQGGSKLDI